jgi:hypothetical protein
MSDEVPEDYCRCKHRRSYHGHAGCCGTIDSITGESGDGRSPGALLACQCTAFRPMVEVAGHG